MVSIIFGVYIVENPIILLMGNTFIWRSIWYTFSPDLEWIFTLSSVQSNE